MESMEWASSRDIAKSIVKIEAEKALLMLGTKRISGKTTILSKKRMLSTGFEIIFGKKSTGMIYKSERTAKIAATKLKLKNYLISNGWRIVFEKRGKISYSNGMRILSMKNGIIS